MEKPPVGPSLTTSRLTILDNRILIIQEEANLIARFGQICPSDCQFQRRIHPRTR